MKKSDKFNKFLKKNESTKVEILKLELRSACKDITTEIIREFSYYLKSGIKKQIIVNIAIVFAELLKLCEQFPSKNVLKWNTILVSFGFPEKVLAKVESFERKILFKVFETDSFESLSELLLIGMDMDINSIQQICFSASKIFSLLKAAQNLIKVL